MEQELENILTQSHALFHKYGIRSVTMDDISRELGISKKTLYQYISDKADLVEKIVEADLMQNKTAADILRSKADNAIEELLQIHKHVHNLILQHNAVFCYDLKKYYPSIYQHITDLRRQQIYISTIDNMNRGIAEGLYRQDMNIAIIGRLPILRMEGKFLHDFFAFEEFAPNIVFNEIFIYHLYGICSQKGRDFLAKRLDELRV